MLCPGLNGSFSAEQRAEEPARSRPGNKQMHRECHAKVSATGKRIIQQNTHGMPAGAT